MYTRYFGMQREPFGITPDPSFLYLSPSHKEALAAVVYGVTRKKGFVAVVGEVGVGKTTILRSFLVQADREKLRTVYIFNPDISFRTLLQTIFRDLGVDPKTDDVPEMVMRMHRLLIREYGQGRTVVVVIDEAQNMPVETLENLRMLSNLETASDKLIQIVFSGQPEFEKLLETPTLRQLRQRIAVKAMIRPLTRDESIDYIRHRLACAGTNGKKVFGEDTLRRIARHAGGIPRNINILCDNCLISTYGRQQKKVTNGLLRQVSEDLSYTPRRQEERRPVLLSLLLAAILLLWVSLQSTKLFGAFAPSVSWTAYAARQSSPAAPLPSPTSDAALPPGAGQPADQGAGSRDTTPAADTAVAASASAEGARVHVVRRGETLATLVSRHYGRVDRKLLSRVMEQNRGLTDANMIVTGEQIVFPPATDLTGGH